MPVTTYTPAATDATFESFVGVPFDDPGVYAAANNKRIDSRWFLKPIQDEVLNLIALALSGGTAVLVRNTTGSTITKGSTVYISGYDTGTSRFLITKADATDPAKQPSLVLDADLATATSGKAYPFKEVTGLNTNSAGAVGDPVYLDGATAGAFAFSVSANGADTQRIGTVTAKHATTGSIRFYPARRLVEKFGKLTATGQILATGTLSPSAIGSNQNDYSPTGLSTANTLRISASAAYNVTGLATGAAGRLLLIHNVGSFAITLKDESASSSAANRFALTADLAVAADAMVLLQYDGTSSRWRAVSGGGSSSSGNLANFGNGADGACAFDGNPVTGFTGTAPYVADRDVYATTVDIDAGQSVNMNGFRLFAKTSAIIDGDIYNNGLDGSLGGAGAPSGTIPGGTAGGANSSGAGNPGTNATNALGGAGGAGGTGGSGAGGAAGTVTVPTAANGGVEIIRALPYAAMFRNAGGTMHSGGTGGGGGGGNGGMTAGGAGGGGGGAVFIASPSITGSGNVNANGGTGQNGAGGGNEGGGGGGGGGVIVTIADNDVTATSITFAALGNAGGTGEGTGTNGAAGSNGRVVHIRNAA